MYRIVVIRTGKPQLSAAEPGSRPEPTICDADGLTEAVYAMLAAQKITPTDVDRMAVDQMITRACTLAHRESFAALQLGDTAMTIRPHAATTP
jgi:hypothetical protein